MGKTSGSEHLSASEVQEFASANDPVLRAKVKGNSFERLRVEADGTVVTGDGTVTPATSLGASGLSWVATKTGAYTAHKNEGVPVDSSGGAVSITTPVGPADGDTFAVKLVIAGNAVTILGPIDGGTNTSFVLVKQCLTFSYDALASTWQIV